MHASLIQLLLERVCLHQLLWLERRQLLHRGSSVLALVKQHNTHSLTHSHARTHLNNVQATNEVSVGVELGVRWPVGIFLEPLANLNGGVRGIEGRANTHNHSLHQHHTQRHSHAHTTTRDATQALPDLFVTKNVIVVEFNALVFEQLHHRA